MVLFDQATYDKLLVEAPKYKLVTPSILSDRMRVCLRFAFFVAMYMFCWLVFMFICSYLLM